MPFSNIILTFPWVSPTSLAQYDGILLTRRVRMQCCDCYFSRRELWICSVVLCAAMYFQWALWRRSASQGNTPRLAKNRKWGTPRWRFRENRELATAASSCVLFETFCSNYTLDVTVESIIDPSNATSFHLNSIKISWNRSVEILIWDLCTLHHYITFFY